MKYSIILFSLIIINFNSLKEIDIIGKYRIEGENYNVHLELKSDNTYTHLVEFHIQGTSLEDNIIIEKIEGNYQKNKQNIILSPHCIINTEHLKSYSINDLDSFVLIKEEAESDTLFFKINDNSLNDTLGLFHFENKLLLLSDDYKRVSFFSTQNDYLELINHINCGQNLNSLIEEGFFLSKDVLLKNNKKTRTKLPRHWRKYVLKKEIQAEIIEVLDYVKKDEFDFIENIVIINKGKKHGLKKGMQLYSIKNIECACDVILTEVHFDYSKGYVQICGPNDCIINTKLSSYCRH